MPAKSAAPKQKPANRLSEEGRKRLVSLMRQRWAVTPRRYVLSPELLEELRLAYVGNTREVSDNLKRISRNTGIPKSHLKYVGHREGWRCTAERRIWTPADEEYLQEKLGTVSLERIAIRLRRSLSSVLNKAHKMELRTKLSEGYCISDLCEVFGVRNNRIENWMRRGLLGKTHGKGGHGSPVRVTAANVVRFLRHYPDEYDLRRVDQVWLKAMLFGSLANQVTHDARRNDAN